MASSPDNLTRVLVVSLPGMMQKLLCETLNSRLDVDLVGVASGGLSAAGMIRQKQPDLVVINSNLPPGEASALIIWLKEEHPKICSLVLAETTQQLIRANSAGADIVMRSYSLGDNLDSVFVNMSAIHTSNGVEETGLNMNKEK